MESLRELPQTLRERLRAAFAKGPPLRLVVLFGSQARGRAVEGSDFDIGIMPIDPMLSLHEELALGSSLSEITGTEVDIVRLDSAPPLLCAEIARDGVCLFEAEKGVFAAFRADAISQWIDFDAAIAPHRARFLRRLSGGGQ